MIKVNFDNIQKTKLFDPKKYSSKVKDVHNMIHKKTGLGHEFLGWLDYPVKYDKDEINRIINKANEFKKKYDTLVVCGIGGSYLGARATIEAINGLFPEKQMEILYFGNTLDPDYSSQIIHNLEKKNFCVCVISKSGTTTETAIGFRILKEMLENKYGKSQAQKRIVAVTDKEKGALKQLATEEKYETYILPSDIGGRFSVMTPVGLFPIACAGIDIKKFLKGFAEGRKEYSSSNINKNDAYKYACERHYLYHKGFTTEMMVSYSLKNKMLIEWWKQLFDESEGKNRKALLCASAIFTTDLHSMGQFIQDGSKVLFETVLNVKTPNADITIKKDEKNLDQLNYIAGKKLSYINNKAYNGTLDAHAKEGKVPNIVIEIDKLDEKTLGHLFYFFMKACAMSAYMEGVNPFDQPGVEIYKKNMFHLLGKKGY